LTDAHLQADVLQWILNRTDIFGTPKEMIIREMISLASAIVDALTKQIAQQEALSGHKEESGQHRELLLEKGAISEKTAEELKWLWAKRHDAQIFLTGEYEFGHCTMKQCNRALRTLKNLKSELDTWYKADMQF
jgi:hypothetical protein